MASRGSGQGSISHKQAQSQVSSVPSARGTTHQIGRCGRGSKPAAGSSTQAQPAPPVTEPPKKTPINIITISSFMIAPPPPLPHHYLDKPSGKTKKDVAAVIARHIFAKDSDHAECHAFDPVKLKTKYCEQHKRFTSTGGSIVPQGDDNMGSQPQNLLEDVLCVFPYYSELDSIWNEIPSFNPQLVSSKPNTNHTASLLNVVASRSNTDALQAAEDSSGVPDDQDVGDKVNEPLARQAVDAEDVAMDDVDWDEHAMDVELLPEEAPRAFLPSSSEQVSSSKSKNKTPLQEGHSAFTRLSPYSHPSPSHSAPSSSKQLSASTPIQRFSVKIEELEKMSLILETGPNAPSKAALRIHYTIWKQELDIQQQELTSRKSEAETEHKCEQKMGTLQIKLQEIQQCTISQCIDLLNKQMEYMQMMWQLGLPVNSSIMGQLVDLGQLGSLSAAGSNS
ncbi:hypothetical protein EV363DRAFT_1295568 [Boletus edulis]|nr:hypothetical protein EV363DRAFT_1295568 [Boletus edulis]